MNSPENIFNSKTVNAVAKKLITRGETLAVAESVTGGFLQAALATAQDASLFLQGGITAYNLGQKYRHLHIEPIQAEQCNCVSQEISSGMASNVCPLFSSHWGMAITGYATPVPESGNKIFAFYSIARNGQIVSSGKIDPSGISPIEVQLHYVDYLVNVLLQQLNK